MDLFSVRQFAQCPFLCLSDADGRILSIALDTDNGKPEFTCHRVMDYRRGQFGNLANGLDMCPGKYASSSACPAKDKRDKVFNFLFVVYGNIYFRDLWGRISHRAVYLYAVLDRDDTWL